MELNSPAREIFFDSGGPSANYGNNENFTLTFTSSNGNRLQFDYQSFNTEINLDVLQIYDGPSTNSPLIGSYSGTNSPGLITSSGTSITFHFISDGTVNNAGWNASITCTTPPLTPYNMTDGQTITTCSGVFYDDGGNTGNYTHNQNRVMTFCPSSNSDYLTINFPYQFILSSDDTLFAYAGNNTSAPLLAKYTLNNRGEILCSPNPGQCITFQFNSNSVNNSSGWQGIINCSSNPVQQFTNMGASTRVSCNMLFYDSGGPSGNYGNNENRTITFYSNGNCGVRVDFSSFSTETNLDILFVYDGVDINAPLIGAYSGTLSPFFVQSSVSNALTFRFISDATVNNGGWVGVVSCLNTPATPTITATPSLNLCINDSIQLTSSLGASYLWNTGDTTQVITVSNPGSYLVRVTDASGCFSWSNPVTVTGGPNNTITLTSASGTNNQSICTGQGIANITYSTTGATGATFSGLPAGVIGSFNNGNILISGIPTVNGVFNYTITLTGGCGNITENGTIIITSIDNSVSLVGPELIANQTGATYQWVVCPSYLPIIGGGNQQNFVPLNSGSFAVIITLNGCVDTSACYNVTVSSSSNSQPTQWNVYPNPNYGKFYLETSIPTSFELLDLTGKSLIIIENIFGKIPIELDLAKGIYILKDLDSSKFRKLIIL